MIGAALYLTQRTLVNSTRRRLARLRQPKYLIGFLVGLLYLWWFAFRRGGSPALGSVFEAPVRQGLAVAILATFLVLNWIFSSTETPFAFTLAETQFLFTAPLTRRQVAEFKILRSQLRLLLSAVFSVLIFGRGAALGFPALLHAAGLWLVYGTLQLNFAAMGLLRLSLAQHGVAGVRRKLVTLAVIATLGALVWWTAASQLPTVGAAFAVGIRPGLVALGTALHTGTLGILMWPLQAVLGPLLANGPAAFVARLPAALLVFAAHYVWVAGSSVTFEEAAVEHAARTARRLEALRQGRGYSAVQAPRTGFKSRRLAADGSPAGAITWKNLTGLLRETRPRTFVLLGGILAVGAIGLRGDGVGGWDLFAGFLLVVGGMTLALGPIVLRFDLRRDLELLEILKSYPIRGQDVVLGEVGAPVVALTALVWATLIGSVVATWSSADLPPVADRVAYLVGALALVPCVLLVLVVVQNAAVLLFPAWITVGPQRATGLEATGQRLLMMIGALLTLVVAIIPSGLVGVGAGAAGAGLGLSGAWAIALGAVVGGALLAVEGWVAIRLLGGVFDRLDPSTAGVT